MKPASRFIWPTLAPIDPDPGQRHVRTIRMFADWIRACGFDLVHGNTLNSFLAIDAAREAGLPSLWTIHESVDYHIYFTQFGAAAVEPALRAFTYPYRVIFVAHATRALFKPLETRHNFSVIHVGLKRDTIEQFMSECSPQDARAAIGCPPDKQVITILGTVAERKGQHVFARAAMELLRSGRRDVVFQIVGCRPNSYLTELREMIQDYEADFRLVAGNPRGPPLLPRQRHLRLLLDERELPGRDPGGDGVRPAHRDDAGVRNRRASHRTAPAR